VREVLNLNKTPEFSFSKSKALLDSPEEIALLKKSSYYVEKSRARDIFKFGDLIQLPVEEEVAPPEEEPSEVVVNPIEHLSLVGISFSDEPDVMIKDNRTQKIHFLKRGEWIEGTFKVESILSDRVILTYQGRELELR
jgi:type II secretory pathway component PulC